MSNYEDRYEDGDRTTVREPVAGQMQPYPQHQYPPQQHGPIAKSGTRSHSDDPRERIVLSWGRDESRGDS